MSRSKLGRAVLNSVHWYEQMFAAHGLAGGSDGRVWVARGPVPPFHSHLVVAVPSVDEAEIDAWARQLPPGGWSMKDSFARLALASRGYTCLFEADWIWRDPGPSAPGLARRRLAWTRVATPPALAAWERAWSGDARNEAGAVVTRQFPDALLASPDHVFFAGSTDGRVVAGGIANRSPGAVGLSNVFAPPEAADETWGALVDGIAAAFPRTPIVGYERGADLDRARAAGFEPVGPLRVWCSPG
jgi:hypothetical protein